MFNRDFLLNLSSTLAISALVINRYSAESFNSSSFKLSFIWFAKLVSYDSLYWFWEFCLTNFVLFFSNTRASREPSSAHSYNQSMETNFGGNDFKRKSGFISLIKANLITNRQLSVMITKICLSWCPTFPSLSLSFLFSGLERNLLGFIELNMGVHLVSMRLWSLQSWNRVYKKWIHFWKFLLNTQDQERQQMGLKRTSLPEDWTETKVKIRK